MDYDICTKLASQGLLSLDKPGGGGSGLRCYESCMAGISGSQRMPSEAKGTIFIEYDVFLDNSVIRGITYGNILKKPNHPRGWDGKLRVSPPSAYQKTAELPEEYNTDKEVVTPIKVLMGH